MEPHCIKATSLNGRNPPVRDEETSTINSSSALNPRQTPFAASRFLSFERMLNCAIAHALKITHRAPQLPIFRVVSMGRSDQPIDDLRRPDELGAPGAAFWYLGSWGIPFRSSISHTKTKRRTSSTRVWVRLILASKTGLFVGAKVLSALCATTLSLAFSSSAGCV